MSKYPCRTKKNQHDPMIPPDLVVLLRKQHTKNNAQCTSKFSVTIKLYVCLSVSQSINALENKIFIFHLWMYASTNFIEHKAVEHGPAMTNWQQCNFPIHLFFFSTKKSIHPFANIHPGILCEKFTVQECSFFIFIRTMYRYEP